MFWLEGGTSIRHQRVPESSRFEFLANNFALSDAEDNTSGMLNKEGIGDLLFSRTLLAITENQVSRK